MHDTLHRIEYQMCFKLCVEEQSRERQPPVHFTQQRVMLPVPAKQYTHNRVLCSAVIPYPRLRTAQILAVIDATPQLETPIELVEDEGEHGSMLRDAWRGCVEGSV